MTNKKILCTFPGKYGDILWSLATVKHIANVYQTKVDFAVMPQYFNLLLLLLQQEFINDTHALVDWKCTGSPHGDQPWQSPLHVWEGYDKVYDLGYRGHPSALIGGPNVQLIDFIASQQGFKLVNPLPFMKSDNDFAMDKLDTPYVAYAFNEYAYDHKLAFLNALKRRTPDVNYVDVGVLPWAIAAATMQNAVAFVGCRSANWVIANGLDKPIITFEPHPERNCTGSMGPVFGCSYGQEHAIALSQVNDIEGSALVSSQWIMIFISKEKTHANVETFTR